MSTLSVNDFTSGSQDVSKSLNFFFQTALWGSG